MTAFFDISAALDGKLDALSGSHEVAWPNKEYSPTKGVTYLRPTMLPADTVPATISTGGNDDHSGVYRIDVFAPSGDGKNAALTLADQIATHFKPVTELTYNGRIVRCMRASIGNATNDGDRYMVPVSIDYMSLTAKR